MVVIHVKFGGGGGGSQGSTTADEFLFETSTSERNDVLIRKLVEVNNRRAQLAFLCGAVLELAAHGPAKPRDEEGSDALQEKYEGRKVEKGATYAADPLGLRTGNGVGKELTKVFDDVSSDAQTYISKDRVAARQALTLAALEDKLANMRGAVAMAYPMGLPPHDPVKLALDSIDGLAGTPAEPALLDPATAQLWCAGKAFERDGTVADRLGHKNEKTKVVAKLQNPGAGPPAREPAVSETERKAMMAHYFKRQEDLKALAEADDDDYLASGWANPHALKNSLQGFSGNVVAPGVRGL